MSQALQIEEGLNCLKPAWRGQLEFKRSPAGKTYLASQYLEYPFHITRPFYLDPDYPELATLYLQSSSGGIVQGDRLQFSIEVQPNAAVHFTTQAGTKIHTMNQGCGFQQVELRVESGAYLEYLVDPVILFPQSRFSNKAIAQVAADATLIFSESFTHHDPKGGRVPAFDWFASEVRIEQLDGKLLAIDRFDLTQTQANWKIPEIATQSGSQGTIFVITQQSSPDLVAQLRDYLSQVQNCYLGVSALPNQCGAWIRILAANSRALRTALETASAACRMAVTGKTWTRRRK